MRTALVCLAAYGAGMIFAAMYPEQQQNVAPIAEIIEEKSDVVAAPPAPQRIREDPDLVLLREIVASEMLRLNVIEPGFKNVRARVMRFIEFVKLIESNGDRYAKARTSSAMSLFQFTRDSVPTAVNRLENYMARHYLGPLPAWATALRAEPTSLYDVPELRQAILTIVNIIEQRGSDELLREFLRGERDVAKALYYAHHHTDPDAATFRRAEKIFSKVFE